MSSTPHSFSRGGAGSGGFLVLVPWPDMVQEVGGAITRPPPFLACQGACSDKGQERIGGGNTQVVIFFFAGTVFFSYI